MIWKDLVSEVFTGQGDMTMKIVLQELLELLSIGDGYSVIELDGLDAQLIVVCAHGIL